MSTKGLAPSERREHLLAEEHLWSELVCDRGYATHTCVQLLLSRGETTLAERLLASERDQDPLLAWAEALVALDDARTLPLLVDLIDESLDGVRSWDAVDVALAGICRVGRPLSVSTLSQLMAHPDVQMRFRAAEALASLEDAEPLRWLSLGRTEDVRVAAAWGLMQLGFAGPALRYLRSHTALLAPRIAGLGARGVNALCECPPALLGDAFDEVAALLGRKRRHRELLSVQFDAGSELARAALEYMDERASRRARQRSPHALYGEEPLTHAELRELREANMASERLAMARRGHAFPEQLTATAWQQEASTPGFEADALWRPPSEPAVGTNELTVPKARSMTLAGKGGVAACHQQANDARRNHE